ncbi:MAG: diadenylate cyclase CdaA [Anaerolineaceae bacterium]|nr:diadenylate cyclase CdaA [Anaerolineaceae bacterium]
MTEFFNDILFLLQRFTWSSILDILLVTIAFSLILWLLKDTEALVLLRGVFLIAILLILLTSLVNLPAFAWLINTVTPALIFAIPVIFAPEIRRALQRVGLASNINFFNRRTDQNSRAKTESVIQAIVKACGRLSERHHGALIIIQRNNFLTQYIKTGVPMDAEVTPELLLQIFYPNTPLHDGAVIIADNLVKSASCVMPLSASGVLNRMPERTMGLRHRASLGISEVSDAIAVVVSEETGGISIAHDGHLIRRLDTERLLNNLNAFIFQSELPDKMKPISRFFYMLRHLFDIKRDD